MISWICSLFLVALGQPAWIPGFGPLAASFGFALFWQGLVSLKNLKTKFWVASFWFACVQGIQLSWMATLDYMGPLILVVYLFLIGAMGIQFGILSCFVEKNSTILTAFSLAGIWIFFEWIRLFFLCGFTWNPVGLSLTASPYSMQLASIFGVFGLSFWVIFVNSLAFQAWSSKDFKKICVWGCAAFIPYLFGYFQIFFIETYNPIKGELKAALVQTALFPEQKERLPEAPEAFIPPLVQWERILGVLDKKREFDLVVFPEAVLPYGAHGAAYDYEDIQQYFSLESLPPLREPYAVFDRGKWKVSNAFLMQALANHYKAHVIAGLDDTDLTGKYNAAFHFIPDNRLYARYEKRILAPIAEYIPLQNWKLFSHFIGKQFGIYSSFDKGKEAKVFQTPFPIGVSICLEETFGHLTREMRLKGAEIFVNLTNDIWFPATKLPRQHFDHGRVRAVENGVPILRACNTGITSALDSFGRVVAHLPISEEKADALYFNLPIRTYKTLYTIWGDWAILALSAAFVIPFARRKGCCKRACQISS